VKNHHPRLTHPIFQPPIWWCLYPTVRLGYPIVGMYIPDGVPRRVMVTYENPPDYYLNRIIDALERIADLLEPEKALEETNLAILTLAEQVENLVEVVEGGQ